MPFRHPRERLIELLRTRGSTPELEAFKQQLRWIARVGGGSGLEHWLDARRELGLVAVESLLLDELLPVLTDDECDRIVAWRLGVSW